MIISKKNLLFLKGVNPTVWTLGYAIPNHTKKLYEEIGHGLGLNSMQGHEAKHVKLAMYIKNTYNLKKKSRWPTVFRHEYVSLIRRKKWIPIACTISGGKERGVSLIFQRV